MDAEDMAIISHVGRPSRPHPSLAVNDVERACFVGSNTNPHLAELYRMFMSKRIQDDDRNGKSRSYYSYYSDTRLVMEEILSPVVAMSSKDMQDYSEDSALIFTTLQTLVAPSLRMDRVTSEAEATLLLARLLLGEDGYPLDTLATLALSPEELGAHFMSPRHVVSNVIINQSGLKWFPHHRLNPDTVNFESWDTLHRGLGDMKGSIKDIEAIMSTYMHPDDGDDMADHRAKVINNMVARTGTFDIYPGRAYRENRSTYLRRLSLDVSQSWDANWRVPAHVYDIMRRVNPREVCISPQTLLIPAFNSFDGTWDFTWYGELLSKAETAHDLNNIGLRFALMDFMDEDRVIELMESPDIPLSWWVERGDVMKVLEKQIGDYSSMATLERHANVLYN